MGFFPLFSPPGGGGGGDRGSCGELSGSCVRELIMVTLRFMLVQLRHAVTYGVADEGPHCVVHAGLVCMCAVLLERVAMSSAKNL